MSATTPQHSSSKKVFYAYVYKDPAAATAYMYTSVSRRHAHRADLLSIHDEYRSTGDRDRGEPQRRVQRRWSRRDRPQGIPRPHGHPPRLPGCRASAAVYLYVCAMCGHMLIYLCARTHARTHARAHARTHTWEIAHHTCCHGYRCDAGAARGRSAGPDGRGVRHSRARRHACRLIHAYTAVFTPAYRDTCMRARSSGVNVMQ